ncbi:MAG: acyltransferase [Proteobacteria bacterium]|nr:MAG: acyltransferase [Pseudomonadota bacterium]
MAYLSQTQLESLNFKYLGKNVKISDKASIYNAKNLYLDDNSRIDDFCILSAGAGGIHIGKYVHIAAYSSLIGAEKITLADFSGVSSRVSIYSSSDDYSGEFLTNPTVPIEYCNVDSRPVYIGKHVIVGAGAIVLPGAKLNIGVAIGSLSLVLGKEYPEFMIYAGAPAKAIKERKRNLLELENKLSNEIS